MNNDEYPVFVDRTQELAALRRRLTDETPQMLRLYGRRRVGKTELLRKLLEHHRGLFLIMDDAERGPQLEALARQLAGPGKALPVLRDWDDFLDAVEAVAPEVVVLDEFQRCAASDPQSVTRLQARWDHSWRKAGPSVILCGSSIGMMQRLTRGRKGPLFGRLTGDLRLKPFGYAACRLLYPDLSEEERIARYAVFGGTPFYHRFSVGRSLRDAVIQAMLEPVSPLLDEPEGLLRLELSTTTRYKSILNAIGNGSHKLQEIEAKVGVRRGGLGPYLRILREDLDLVRMETPVGGKAHAARYVFSDPFFAFYYRFVHPRRARIELGDPEAVWRDIAADLEAHVGRVFESVVQEALLKASEALGGGALDVQAIGRWWDRLGEEVDVVAMGSREVWIGEVKWSRRRVDAREVYELDRKMRLVEVRGGRSLRPFIAARGGVTPEAGALLRERGGFVVTLGDMAKAFERAESATRLP